MGKLWLCKDGCMIDIRPQAPNKCALITEPSRKVTKYGCTTCVEDKKKCFLENILFFGYLKKKRGGEYDLEVKCLKQRENESHTATKYRSSNFTRGKLQKIWQ